ncbi:MAG: tetratricopeptide repeat protein [Candidatus Lokiarchaeota archaeon]|nr:tetratricopeptide repeat protein [Candidatus Lokiarchaeota archaeon]
MNEKDLNGKGRQYIRRIKEFFLPRSSLLKKKDSANLESENLINIENLINEGKFEEALSIINDCEGMNDLSDSDLTSCTLLKSYIFNRTGKFKEGFRVAEKVYKKSQVQNKFLQSSDALTNMALARLWLVDYNKAHNLITQSEELLQKLSKISTSELKRREASIAYIKGLIYWFQGDFNNGLRYAKESLELNETVGNKIGIAESLYGIGQCLSVMKGDLDQALIYIEQSRNLAKELNYRQLLLLNTINLGVFYTFKGEFRNSLTVYNQALPIAEELDIKQLIILIKNNLGLNFKDLGKWDEAIKNMKQSIKLAKEAGFYWLLINSIGGLIEILVYKGDIKQAQVHLEEMKQFIIDDDSKVFNWYYQYCEAIILKASPRIHNRAKAEEILKRLVQKELTNAEITINSLINLCDLLLEELKSTNDFEILKELEPLIAQLLNIAENSNSNWVLAETYTLQAKLALLTSDPKDTRRLLTKAQEIAESGGMQLLAAKISSEHDSLLKELSKWEDLKDKNIPLTERMELAHIDDQMKSLLWDRDLSSLEYTEEDPVIILILAEGGVSIFSHIFSKDWSYEDDLVGGFLSAMNSFSGELFSEGLDRAKFGKHTVLMKPFASFFACYLFKGQSYLANKKLSKFIKNIETNKRVKIIFESYYKNHKTINLEENPPLEELFTEVFIQKIP